MVEYHSNEFFELMGRKRNSIPSYMLHKKTGSARTCWGDVTVYLGKHGTPESLAAYQQTLALFFSTGKIKLEKDSLVSTKELVDAFLKWVKTQHDSESTEPRNHELALRGVVALFGGIPAKDFRAPQMTAVRDMWILKGNSGTPLTRGVITKYQRYVVRCFRWGVATERIPASSWDALRALEKLKKRRSAAREPERVKPVCWEHVVAIKPHVSRQVWSMVLLMWHTGMRPGEVVLITWQDIDRSKPVWIYSPNKHKTEYRDIERHIGIGKQAQEVLREWIDRPPDVPIFSPAQAEAERHAILRANRKTPVQPSQTNRTVAKPAKIAGDFYKASSFGKRVGDAAEAAGLPRWSPNRIRHSFATRVRSEIGLHAAQVALGHQHADVTQVYAEKDLELVIEVAEKLG